MRERGSSTNPPTPTPHGKSKLTIEATDTGIICEAVSMILEVHLLNITSLMSSSML